MTGNTAPKESPFVESMYAGLGHVYDTGDTGAIETIQTAINQKLAEIAKPELDALLAKDVNVLTEDDIDSFISLLNRSQNTDFQRLVFEALQDILSKRSDLPNVLEMDRLDIIVQINAILDDIDQETPVHVIVNRIWKIVHNKLYDQELMDFVTLTFPEFVVE